MAVDDARASLTDQEVTKNVVAQKIGPGDLIQLPPVFTYDAKYICLVSGFDIRVYSVDTSDKVHDINTGRKKRVVGLALVSGSIIASCDEDGRIASWDAAAGKQVEEIPLGQQGSVTSFLVVSPKKYLAAVLTGQNNTSDVFLYEKTHNLKPRRLIDKVVGLTAVAYGCKSEEAMVVAALRPEAVVLKDTRVGTEKKIKAGQRRFTCVALHHEQLIMATGDISGRVLVWNDFMRQPNPVFTSYHWHQLPVNSVCFSEEGNHMYSGGSENVLVKWRLTAMEKRFIPRMGANIKYIVQAPENRMTATSNSDNAIRLINTNFKVERAIIAVIKHEPIHTLKGVDAILPTGLVRDNRTRSVFFNGQAGHLQLFNLDTNSITFNLDITDRNILTNERDFAVGNTEVMRASVSPDGTWLSTVEMWSSKIHGLQDINLKFWCWNVVKSNYELNTNVVMPHREQVIDLAFQTGALGQQSPCLVSIGKDDQFKIWRLEDDTDIYRKGEAWRCDVAGDFRNLSPGALSFSEDGSLLAIAFKDIITLWDPRTSSLKATLAHGLMDRPICFLEFGRDQSSRHLVCASNNCIFSWDVITRALLWKVDRMSSDIVALVADPVSMFMATVLSNSQVFVFAPSSSKPVFQQKTTLGSAPASAVFIPRPNPLTNGPEWLASSRLIIASLDQELFVLDDVARHGAGKRVNQLSYVKSLPWTPFAAMRAEQQVTEANKLMPKVHEARSIKGYETVQSLVNTSASALPPMSRLCGSFMKSFLKPHEIDSEASVRSGGRFVAFARDSASTASDVGRADPILSAAGLSFDWLVRGN